MALSGDLKENYKMLQNSTGERYAHMADRLTSATALSGLDENAREGNRELADWLRTQTDDEEAVQRKINPPDAEDAARAREQASRAELEAKTKAPQGRSAGGKSNG